MAKLHLVVGSMNSSKTSTLIMNAFNYTEEGQNAVILKPSIDTREGTDAKVYARTGLSADCTLFDRGEDLFILAAKLAGANHTDCSILNYELQDEAILDKHARKVKFSKEFKKTVDCFLVDEVQFLSVEQAKQLLDVVDYLNIPVLAFGLRNDFKANPFPATTILLAEAEEIKENKGICWCGKKSTHVLRVDEHGMVDTDGPQIKVGGNDTYRSVCRFHFKAKQYKKPV